MNLTSQLQALKKNNSNLPLGTRAELSCNLAKQLEKAGEYEAAAEAVAEFWPDTTRPPKLDGLDEPIQAEVLLRVGALAALRGSADQAFGSQETAKDLITKSIEIFENLGQAGKRAEAQADLALCYWREGAFDEARIHLKRASESLKDERSDLRACVLIRSGAVETDAGHLNEALRLYDEALPLLDRSDDHVLKGAFHSNFARLFRRFGRTEGIDRALIEYAAASFHFEEAGHTRNLARVENNLGYLFLTIGRYNEAHQRLDRARGFFIELRDSGMVAQVDETRARTFLAEGRLAEADRLIRSVVKTLERGDEQAILAEALTTYGTVTARLGRFVRSRELLDRAIDIAQTVGDLEGAGRAKLSIIEELVGQTSAIELAAIFETATELLQKSQDPSVTRRLISCARRVIDALKPGGATEGQPPTEASWEEFSLRQQVRNYEKALIERALRDAGGAVTKAAHLLGFKHHQSLISLINSRHRDLLGTRSAVRKRRSHIFSNPRKPKKRVVSPPVQRSTSRISILHVEDHKLVAQLVNDLLSAENWQVEHCADSDTALRKLTGNEHFDVLVVDNDLEGLTGLELIQRTRKMTHRRRTPIIMLSGGDYETAAWRVGVDAFLQKPEEISDLPTTVNRLLRDGARNT